MSKKFKYKIHRKRVLELFFRTELRPNEKVIDNMDETIAKEAGLSIETVSRFIREHLNNKYNNLKF